MPKPTGAETTTNPWQTSRHQKKIATHSFNLLPFLEPPKTVRWWDC